MGTTEEELRHIVYDLGLAPYYLGSFDKTFPGFINKHKMCCAIVNTALRITGGVHWIAFAWYPPKQLFYIFDPFGFSDTKLNQIYNFQYEKLLKHSALSSSPGGCVTVIKSTDSVQGPNSAACGLFCCLFLYAFVHFPTSAMNNPIMDIVKGVPNSKLYLPSSQNVFTTNQKNLYTFLHNRCLYFKQNEAQIKLKTNGFRVS